MINLKLVELTKAKPEQRKNQTKAQNPYRLFYSQ